MFFVSVKHGLLALLAEQPMYGAQLRSEFEDRTGGTWPLNIGQVYTTLARLQRDGLVTHDEADNEGKVRYWLTDKGQHEAELWFSSAVDRTAVPRDEMVIKLALASTSPNNDVADVIHAQRVACITQIGNLTRQKHALQRQRHQAPENTTTDQRRVDAALLVLESHIFAVEADARWLDHVESRLRSAHKTRLALSQDLNSKGRSS